MFESLTERFNRTFKKITGRGRLSEANIQDALKEVRLALLEADVNYKVVKRLVDDIRKRAVAIPGKTQSDIMLGYPGPARSEPDFLDAVVCNTILGVFGLMGRLGDKVREEQGLAYYSFSRVDGGPGPGPWRVIAGVNPANVDQAVASIRAEIRRICEEPVDEEELKDNRAFITGSLPLRLETNEGVARTIINMERYGLGLDYLRRYTGLINEITAERVQAVAQRWLDSDAYALAVAGPPPA